MNENENRIAPDEAQLLDDVEGHAAPELETEPAEDASTPATSDGPDAEEDVSGHHGFEY